VKSGTDEAAASFMRARWPVFGIAYRMLGSASEASEKPAALQSTRGPNMFSSHVPGFGAARPGLVNSDEKQRLGVLRGKMSKIEEVFFGSACYTSQEAPSVSLCDQTTRAPSLMREVWSIRQMKQDEKGGK
jgi:hypothetical protein